MLPFGHQGCLPSQDFSIVKLYPGWCHGRLCFFLLRTVIKVLIYPKMSVQCPFRVHAQAGRWPNQAAFETSARAVHATPGALRFSFPSTGAELQSREQRPSTLLPLASLPLQAAGGSWTPGLARQEVSRWIFGTELVPAESCTPCLSPCHACDTTATSRCWILACLFFVSFFVLFT